MELRQLEYFISVARLGNVTRAAEEHFVTQPNLTVAIRKLEEELNITLFVRDRKKMRLTNEGLRFYKVLVPALTQLHQVIDDAKDGLDKVGGRLTIGIPPMIGTFIFTPLLKYMCERHPNWELVIVEEGSVGIRRRLLQQELNLGIVITDNLPLDLSAVPLWQDEHKLCVPIDHPLATEETITFEDLRQESLILMKVDSFHRRRITEYCNKAGFDPHIVLSSNQIQNNIDSVAAGLGLSFLLSRVAIHRDDVILRSMSPALTVNIGIAWPKTNYLPAVAKDIIHFISQQEPKP